MIKLATASANAKNEKMAKGSEQPPDKRADPTSNNRGQMSETSIGSN